jgi:hypothetical protein
MDQLLHGLARHLTDRPSNINGSKGARMIVRTFRMAALLVLLATPSFAAPVYWTHWQTQTAGAMTGEITLQDLSTIDVTYSGDHYVGTSQLSGGFDYWAAGPDSTYESAQVDNRPPNGGIVTVGKNTADHTVTFSRAITNPIFAIMSLNVYGLQLEDPFVVLSSGCGYWGCANLIDVGGNLLRSVGGGEGHGVIMLPGTFTSLTFHSEGPEGWRGFTIGVQGAAQQVPEPAILVLTSLALGAAGWRRRRG